MKTYWHFIKENRKLGYGDGRLVEAGKTLTVDCNPILCKQGLHASERLIDALNYAPGLTLCKVTLGGKIVEGDDKVVATERTVIAIADVSDITLQWSKRVALDVIHLWDAPPIVLEFLNGDNTKAKEAEKASSEAWAACVESAAWAAASAAASAASAVASAAELAVSSAAWAAAWAAASATGLTERTASMDRYNDWLKEMVEQATWEIAE